MFKNCLAILSARDPFCLSACAAQKPSRQAWLEKFGNGCIECCDPRRNATVVLFELWRREVKGALFLKWIGKSFSLLGIGGLVDATYLEKKSLQLIVSKYFDDIPGTAGVDSFKLYNSLYVRCCQFRILKWNIWWDHPQPFAPPLSEVPYFYQWVLFLL